MKIVTALNNPEINIKLKKEKSYEIIGKDIQYKEAILEILEKNNKIDLIIINYKLPGEINLEKLVNKIKEINKKIKIIILLTNKEKDKINFLRKIGIKNIHIIDKINYCSLLKILNNSTKNKKIINNEKHRNISNTTVDKLKKVILIKGSKLKDEEMIIKLLIKYFINKNKKVLLIKIKNKYLNNNYRNHERAKNEKINVKEKLDKQLYIINYSFKKYKNYKIKDNIEIEKLIDKNKDDFDFIIIQIEKVKEEYFYEEIIKRVNNVLIFIQSNINDIANVRYFIERFKSSILKYDIDLQIIESKFSFYSVSTKILKNIFGISLKKFSINLNNKKNNIFFEKIINFKLNIKIRIILFHLLKNKRNKINKKWINKFCKTN